MTRKFARNCSTGMVAQRERSRLDILVRSGKASWWLPYRNVDDALKAAGLI